MQHLPTSPKLETQLVTNDELRKLLKDHGVSGDITDNQLRGYRTITRGITDPAILTKKIKDRRKTLYGARPI